MKFTSPIIAMGSGSIGGATYSHNRYGKYIREKVKPVNPNTARQVAVRNWLSGLAARWRDVLTNAQRLGWTEYANQTTTVGKLGESQTLTGLNMFVAANVLRQQAGLAIISAPPAAPGLAQLSAVSGTLTASNDTVSLAFTNTDGWAGEVGGALLLYGSTGRSAAINYFNGPYRYANKVSGAVTPPTSPASIVLADNIIVAQKVFLKAVCVRADGRFSAPFRLDVTAAS